MQIIRCTQKLLKEINPEIVDFDDKESIIGDWHANLVNIQRRKCVIVTNGKTLFTMFIPFLREFEFQHFDKIFRDNLFNTFLSEGFKQKQIETALDEHEEIVFGKTNNRSVLGSMLDQKYVLNTYLSMYGGLDNISIIELNKYLNRNILSAIKMNNPVEMMKSIMADY